MGQRAPTAGQIAVAVAFAFSCFGLLLFLWATFGGPVPLKPEGYRIKVPFSEATQLAQESDVRIHNVSVGKVKSITLENSGPNRDLALATLEIDTPYAPIPVNTRAMLRQKTLLGETYVELTQGDRNAPKLPEGGTLPRAQVEPSVQLDEVFRTFDPKTRAAFQTWMQQLAIASYGRGADISAAIANLAPFAEDANKVLRVLDTQQGAVQQLVRNTGEVFGALSERQGQLAGLIRNSGIVFHTTAVRNQDLEATFRALPTFLDESKLTLNRLASFSQLANPVITHLHPAARAAQCRPQADREGHAGLQGLLRRPAKDAEAWPDRAAGPPDAAQQRSPAPAHRAPSVHPAAHADHLGDRALPERHHGPDRELRRRHQRRRHDRSGRRRALHPQLGAHLPRIVRELHVPPPRLLPHQPLHRAQQRAQGRHWARHIRYAALREPARHRRDARTGRQLHRQPVLREPGDLRHPAAAPRHDQAVPLQRSDDHRGAALAGLHEAAAAALDRADRRDERLHPRLRQPLGAWRSPGSRYRLVGSRAFTRTNRTTTPNLLC